MDREIFFQENKIVKDAYAMLVKSHEISREDYVELLLAYEKLLKQTMHITNISDKLSKNLNEYKHELLEKINVDELTGIYNRRYLFALLEKYFTECKRGENPIAAIMIDIDCFKNYNDYYGHLAGDICLKEVAEIIMKSIMRPCDFVARYGGEEFYVILPSTSITGAVHVAEKIANNIANIRIAHEKNSTSKYITVSMGVAAVIPNRNMSMVSLLDASDKALYLSKKAGRNCITIGHVMMDFLDTGI